MQTRRDEIDGFMSFSSGPDFDSYYSMPSYRYGPIVYYSGITSIISLLDSACAYRSSDPYKKQ